MDIYKEMYLRLFNRITDIIQELEKIQAEAKEMFISYQPEGNIIKVPCGKERKELMFSEKAMSIHTKSI